MSLRALTPFAAALALGAALVFAHPALAAQAVLKGTILAQGEKVTLGDLFDETAFATDPEAAHVPVLSAPRPGESLSLDALALQRFAASHHVEWLNTQGLTVIKIDRASTQVSGAAIERAILDALEVRGLSGRYQLRYAGAVPALYIAAGSNAAVTVQSLNADPATGQFAATIRADASASAASATVSGRAYKIAELPVLARDVKPGDTITQRDITLIDVPAEKIGQNVVTDANDLFGMAARRMLRSGEPLRLGDIEAPILVKKNTLVTMSMQAPGISLTAEGRAIEDGAKGEAIRVMNTASKRIVVATVQGEGLVFVGAAAPRTPTLAAADNAAPIN
jgi:flagella basal body P-ring formation protein FlgA